MARAPSDTKLTKSLAVMVDKDGILLESRKHGWKQYIDVFRRPHKFAKELRKVANWLDKQ